MPWLEVGVQERQQRPVEAEVSRRVARIGTQPVGGSQDRLAISLPARILYHSRAVGQGAAQRSGTFTTTTGVTGRSLMSHRLAGRGIAG